MIHSFRCSETELIWNGETSRVLRPDIQRRALNKLRLLAAAARIEDLRVPPSNHLEVLRGDRAGQWSIRINDRWRICFRWEDGAHEVEIVDYH